MAAPTALSGSTTLVTIDGTDLHTYGMIVNNINNPVPRSRSSSIKIFGKHGDFDFSKKYESRSMIIEGYVIADSSSDLYSYIDSLKEFFRLRENGDSFQVIFQNQSTRYWECKYEGEFNISVMSKWYSGVAASYSLRLKCVVPYAQKTTVTTINTKLNALDFHAINYAGNIDTPINLRLSAPMDVNVAEKTIGAINTDHTLWTKSNCTGSNSSAITLYPDATGGVKFTRSAAGAFYAYVDIISQIDTDKNYCAFVHAGINGSPKISSEDLLDFSWINSGAGGSKTTNFNKIHASSTDDGDLFAFLKISSADLQGAVVAQIRLYAYAGHGDSFSLDGLMVYEITDAELADDNFWPVPYVQDASGDDKIPLVNPSMILYNSRNICLSSHGDNVTGWTGGGQVVSDPILPDKSCVALYGGGSDHTTKVSYARGAKLWQVRFKYYLPGLQTVDLDIKGWPESKNGGTYTYDEYTLSVNTEWEEAEYHAEAVNSELGYIYLSFDVPSGAIMYIKEIQISDYDTYSDLEYEKNSAKEFTWTGTVDENDHLIINSDRMIGSHIDDSESEINNAIANFSGDKLLLTPGYNLLKLADSRINSANPSTASSGSANAVISYRERYL